eukprot:3869470-Rhodomonas_salina.2
MEMRGPEGRLCKGSRTWSRTTLWTLAKAACKKRSQLCSVNSPAYLPARRHIRGAFQGDISGVTCQSGVTPRRTTHYRARERI